MKTLIVEGWRFLPQSYAVVNSYQCLELLKRQDVALYHRDVPYFDATWRPVPGLLPVEQEAALGSIPVPPAGAPADAVLRIDFPHRLDKAADSDRLCVWATTEYKRLLDVAIADGKRPWDALSRTPATLIACSNWAAKGLLNSGAPKAKVVVVPCGVDTSLFRPPTPDERAAARKALGWDGKFVALNVSAMTRNKGIDIAMKAVAALADRHPTLHLALKGLDSVYSSNRNLGMELKVLSGQEVRALEGRVAYQGELMSGADVVRLYHGADVYLSPYRAEGFNLPVLEAAACGLPVICTRGGSTEDFVDDSWTLRVDSKEVPEPHRLGEMLEPRFEHLLSQLERAIQDEAWRASASAAGPAWAQERFTWKHSVDKLLRVLFP